MEIAQIYPRVAGRPVDPAGAEGGLQLRDNDGSSQGRQVVPRRLIPNSIGADQTCKNFKKHSVNTCVLRRITALLRSLYAVCLGG